jgi:hypothetical protein
VPREPRIGEPLPRADEAVIPRAKLFEYALNPDNPKGRHKAMVFKRALAIQQRDWKYLHDAILAVLPDHRVSSVRRPTRVDGMTTFGVIVPIRGLNGRTLPVLTAWMLLRGRPQLTSVRVAKGPSRPGRKRSTL